MPDATPVGRMRAELAEALGEHGHLVEHVGDVDVVLLHARLEAGARLRARRVGDEVIVESRVPRELQSVFLTSRVDATPEEEDAYFEDAEGEIR